MAREAKGSTCRRQLADISLTHHRHDWRVVHEEITSGGVGHADSGGGCRSRHRGAGRSDPAGPSATDRDAMAGAAGAGRNVRAAVLALLLERPMHGYEMITELESRTGGVWRPSPGSVYPTLQLLEDEGLIVSEESGGRKRFTLTEAGRAEAERASEPPPWEQFGDDAMSRTGTTSRTPAVGAMHALRAGHDDRHRRAAAAGGRGASTRPSASCTRSSPTSRCNLRRRRGV